MKNKLSDRLRPLLLGAALIAGTTQAQFQALDRVIAIVDNDVIMHSQLEQRVEEIQRNVGQRGGQLPPQAELEQQVLERLIVENLQLQIADRSGIRISDEELNQALATIAQRNNLTLDEFRAALGRDGLSFEHAREQVRQEMLISRVRQRRVAERVQVSEQEVQNFLASDLGKMQLSEDFRIANLLIPVPDPATNDQVQAAAQKVSYVYEQLLAGADFGRLAMTHSGADNALDGGEIGWRKAAQLSPAFAELLSSMKPGDFSEPLRMPGGFMIVKLLEKRGGDVSMRDEVKVRHILIKPSEVRSDAETQRLVQRLHQRISAGEDFAELASRFSEDPGSARNGGSLDWIDPESLVPEFRQVMLNSPQGQLSQPFRTQFGWHILEVLDRRATDNSAEQREMQALSALRSRKYDEELQTWLHQIRDEAYVEIKL